MALLAIWPVCGTVARPASGVGRGVPGADAVTATAVVTSQWILFQYRKQRLAHFENQVTVAIEDPGTQVQPHPQAPQLGH